MLGQGHAQRVVVADLNGLKSHLDGLTSAQAITWGVTKQEAVAVCTQGNAEAQQAGAIARTRENFQFMAAPGPGPARQPSPCAYRLWRSAQ